jgi:hypothetical protein
MLSNTSARVQTTTSVRDDVDDEERPKEVKFVKHIRNGERAYARGIS